MDLTSVHEKEKERFGAARPAPFFVVTDLKGEGDAREQRERITAIISTRIQLFTPRDCC